LSLLPSLYLAILACVVGSNLIALVLGHVLVQTVPKWLQVFLCQPVGFSVTGERVLAHLFESALMQRARRQVWVLMMRNGNRRAGHYITLKLSVIVKSMGQSHAPVRYWSGCPPDMVTCG